MRREWIEIQKIPLDKNEKKDVSLHAEGVD